MRCYFRICGNVQGIGYRYFVIKTAQKISLTGWVQNCPNGDVEAEAQGDETNLKHFETELESGHSWARVTQVTKEIISNKKGEKNFEIRY